MISVLFFGPLKTLVPSGVETMAWVAGNTDDLLSQLRARGPEWQEALGPKRLFRLAINRQLLQTCADIRDGDEVALIPPVTGG